MALIVASTIDHTLLKPEATADQVERLCEEAARHGFAAVCVNPCWVTSVKALLTKTLVKTCSVVGFPLGAATTLTKEYEARKAVGDGAHEVDMVINVGMLKSGMTLQLAHDMKSVRDAVPEPLILKVIIESAVLTNDEIRLASKICMEQGADFVKTSTGFHPSGGAKVEHVRLIKEIVGDKALIKASGGIKNYTDVLKLIEAGASRIGTSSGVAIVEEAMRIQG